MESWARPLSFAQERLWFLDQINPGDPSASVCRAFRISGELNPDLVKQSLQSVVTRHESLRTTFATMQLNAGVDSKPVQLVAPNLMADLASIDVSLVTPAERESKVRDLARAEAQRPFDLTLGPLFRMTLIKLDVRDHVLILNLHRIVCDEQSVDILMRDLGEYYSSLTNRVEPELATLQIQFADYARWQQEQVSNEVHCDYWKGKLGGAPVVVELPTAHGRPAIQSWRGESLTFQIEKQLSESVRSLSRDHDADLFATLTAAFQLLISRYSGQHDVVTGLTFPNRHLPETIDLIGPIANRIALRTDLSGNPTFPQLLERVKREIVSARAHAAMPFEKLIDELQVERTLSHAPVFQIAINLKERTEPDRWIEGLSVDEFEFDTGVAALDLNLEIVDKADRLNCRFEYASDLFERTTVKRIAEHFLRLLSQIALNPNQRIGHFSFLNAEELDQILREWNNTNAAGFSSKTFSVLFEKQLNQTPGAVAVQFGEKSLTYAELNQKANQLAHYLQERGVGPDRLTGIFFNRSLEMVVALLGILKAGGAYIPLDISYPPERLSFMLNDTAVTVVLTQEQLLPLLPECGAEIVCVDRDHQELERQSDVNPAAQISGENLAYVIYTSGSTGKPKGVQVSHSALANLLSAMRERISASDILLSVTTLSFDIATLEICLPLTVGARCVIASREDTMDGLALAQLIDRCGATLMQATPATWRLLIEAGWKGNDKLRIISGGEALSRPLANQLLDRIAELWNQYGPTETAIYSTAKRISSASGEITIGTPIANTQTYILDPHLKPVPIGVAGELYIGGDGVARGYLNRPGLTAERFVPNPFSTTPGQRLYQTGDRARFDESGEIELVGRLDHQVKVRGYRIELGEIETVLNSHPLVRQSVVTATPDSHGEQRLTGYFVREQGDAPGPNGIEWQLRDHLKAHVPDYMIPQHLVMLEAFPLTPNGKIDRRQLPKPDTLKRESRANYVAPRDNLEKQLAAMWESVLGTKPVGLRDNFFELGGHSLLAARLFAQIENKLGKHIPLATLFKAPTVEQLSRVFQEMDAPGAWPSLVAIQPEGSKPPLFCIHAAGANVLIYRPLSRHLGNDQPVYALQAQGLDGQTKPYNRVEDMAAHYIKEMRALQPEGPYHLLGASFGGLVVYEMAYQLIHQGQAVGLLAMLNTDCPLYSFRKRVASHLVHLRQLGPRVYAGAVLRGIARRFNIHVATGDNSSHQNGHSTAPDPELQQVLESTHGHDEPLIRTVLAIMDAEEAYVLKGKTYRGKITYFRAIDARSDFHDNRLGWRNLAKGGFEVYDVPGTHTSMREEPTVAVLVEKLKPCLDKAQKDKSLLDRVSTVTR